MAAAVGRLAALPALRRGAAVHPARACQWLNPIPAAGVVSAVGSATMAPHQRLSMTAPRMDVASMSDEEKLQCIASGTAPACGTRYVELSAAVFGGAVPVPPGEPGTRTGRKILRAPLKGPALLDWCVAAAIFISLCLVRPSFARSATCARSPYCQWPGAGRSTACFCHSCDVARGATCGTVAFLFHALLPLHCCWRLSQSQALLLTHQPLLCVLSVIVTERWGKCPSNACGLSFLCLYCRTVRSSVRDRPITFSVRAAWRPLGDLAAAARRVRRYAPTGASYKDNPFRLTEKQVRWKAKLDALRKYGKGPPKKKKS